MVKGKEEIILENNKGVKCSKEVEEMEMERERARNKKGLSAPKEEKEKRRNTQREAGTRAPDNRRK